MREPAHRLIKRSLVWAGVCAGAGAVVLLPDVIRGRPLSTLPLLVGGGTFSAALIPFVDRGPRGDGGSPRPSDRKTGVLLFTMFCGAGLTITFLGAFFRGPGYAWTLPWQGLYFAL